jgi:hypothetical protein
VHPPVASGKLRISIISQEEFTNKAMDALSAAAEQAKSLQLVQGTTQHQTAELAKALSAKPAMDDADKAAADRLAGQQSTIASQTQSLAQSLRELQSLMQQNNSDNQELKDLTKEVGDLLNSTAESSMKNASTTRRRVRPAPPMRCKER